MLFFEMFQVSCSRFQFSNKCSKKIERFNLLVESILHGFYCKKLDKVEQNQFWGNCINSGPAAAGKSHRYKKTQDPESRPCANMKVMGNDVKKAGLLSCLSVNQTSL